MTQEELFKKLIAHCKEYGFIFPSSEIYDGLSAVYDYGQLGVELKNNIKTYWWDSMTKLHDNIVGIDAAIFMHPRVWEASGHVGAFNDPLIDNKDSKKRYRADVLIEDWIAKQDEKIEKECAKAAKRFGESFDKEMFLQTNGRVLEIKARRDEINRRMAEALNANDLAEVRQIILDCEIVCPISGTRNWTDVRQFNLMFSTQMGSVADGANTVYLRPETAQGIFVNFLNVQKTGRMKIPFGIAQIGKAFRNEIVARQFIFRMREFEQMEMQFFVRPGEEMMWWNKWKETRMSWHRALGFGDDNYRFHDHEKLAHYANAATDVEFNFPFGFKEVEGIHSRTDYDLGRHQQYSGKKIQYFDPETGESYVPYVDGSDLIAVVNEVFFLEAQIHNVVHHVLLESVAEACLVGQGSHIAVLVCPLVHHVELDITAVDIQLMQQIGNLPVGGVGVTHDHDTLLIQTVRIHDPLDHIGDHNDLKLVVAAHIQLDVGVGGVLAVHGNDVFKGDFANPVDLRLVLKGVKIVTESIKAHGFFSFTLLFLQFSERLLPCEDRTFHPAWRCRSRSRL